MNELEIEELAADFWSGTDLADIYPRPIEQALALKFPVTVVKLPVVNVRAIGRWLRQHDRAPALPSYRRDLMGCLYAHGGQGFIFLCGADSPQEQRFTLAHDAAHFLVDYWRPRLQVIQALGASIIDVLDGHRVATRPERASAILAHVRVGPHWHLLPRSSAHPDGNARIACVEDRADELGLELVAPRQGIVQRLDAMPVRQRQNRQASCRALGEFFGLPPYVFETIVAARQRARIRSFVDEARHILGR